jgi:hypothetical protein
MEGRTCLRCGAPYEPDDTVCYRCGAPIGETRANTQPVRALRRPTPTVVESDAPPSTAALPARSGAGLSGPITTPPPAASPSSSRAARPTKRRPLWLLLLLGCALLLGAFGGAAYLLRLLTAGPAVSQQTSYTDPRHRFSFARPTLWQVSTSATGVSLSDADGISTASVTVRAADFSDTAATAADAVATPLGLATQPQQQFAGVTWEQRSGQVTGQDGAVRQYVVLAAIHNSQVYVIEFTCPISSYDSTNTLVYQPLLDSFAFGAAG